MKKIQNRVYLVLFLLLLLIPLVLTNTKENVVSQIDNRQLAEAPTLGETDFTWKLETYLQDRIGLRNQMINGYALLNDCIADELTQPIYTYGKDGYIFFEMENNITFSDYHRCFAEMVAKMQQYCEERGTKFYFMFEPEKTSVLRRYLPDGVNYDDSWVEEMMNYMDELGVNYINNTELLTQKSYDEMVFNRKYDAGHWNDLGCFYGTNNLLQRINKDFPAVTELSKDEFNISKKEEPYLFNFRIDDEVPVFELKEDYIDITKRYKSEIELIHPYFHYFINNAENADELPKTMIFQGSYYNRGPQFLVSRTSEDIAIHNYNNVINLDYYYNIFQPEVVVFEVAEYTFWEEYFNSNQMSTIDWNPALIDVKSTKSMNEQINEMQDDLALFQVDAYCNLQKGKAIDNIYIDRKFSDVQYGYLITENQIFDLKKNNEGLLAASLEHGELASGEEVTLFCRDNDGKQYYSPMSVRESKTYDVSNYSTNVTQDEENYELSTTSSKNIFNGIGVQLLKEATGEVVEQILTIGDAGEYNEEYKHERDSGWYTLRLKVNGSMKDEYIDIHIYLNKNETYYYSFDVKEFQQDRAVFSDFEVLGYSNSN